MAHEQGSGTSSYLEESGKTRTVTVPYTDDMTFYHDKYGNFVIDPEGRDKSAETLDAEAEARNTSGVDKIDGVTGGAKDSVFDISPDGKYLMFDLSAEDASNLFFAGSETAGIFADEKNNTTLLDAKGFDKSESDLKADSDRIASSFATAEMAKSSGSPFSIDSNREVAAGQWDTFTRLSDNDGTDATGSWYNMGNSSKFDVGSFEMPSTGVPTFSQSTIDYEASTRETANEAAEQSVVSDMFTNGSNPAVEAFQDFSSDIMSGVNEAVNIAQDAYSEAVDTINDSVDIVVDMVQGNDSPQMD